MLSFVSSSTAFADPRQGRVNEVWSKEQTEAAGIVWRGNHTKSPLPHETLGDELMPDAFTWCNK